MTDPRQPAYDAVFEEIRRDASRNAWSNPQIWRCVHAALNAVNVGDPVDPQTGRPISPDDLERFKARWRKAHRDPQAVVARWLGAEIEEEP